MATSIAWLLVPSPWALAVAIAIDLAIGDPEYRFHPVRLIGGSLRIAEHGLRRIGLDGYGGGILLFLVLAGLWLSVLAVLARLASALWSGIGWVFHVFVLYSFMALGDLLRHGRRIEQAVAAGNLEEARRHVSKLVGRDTEPMDGAACRRAAVESLSENLTDAHTSALFWYAIGGLPALTVFKVVSTMDSMVGYRTPRYRQFGWYGARLDDVMNFVPARMTWLLISGVAAALPGYSGRKALQVGFDQHAVLPGPNAGWSEAALAGAVRRRLVGPIWRKGRLVTDQWLGDPADPPLETARDYETANRLITVTGLSAAVGAVAILLLLR